MDKGTQIMLAILIAKLANSYYKRRLPGSWVLLRPTNNRITSVTMRPDISPMFLNFMIAQGSRIKPQAASTTTADIFCFCFFFLHENISWSWLWFSFFKLLYYAFWFSSQIKIHSVINISGFLWPNDKISCRFVNEK